MKRIELNNLQVFDGPFDAIEKIGQRTSQRHVGEEALYICNLSDIFNKHKIWKESMPRVIPHYAVKCNDSAIVLKTLALLGAGFDCASKSEINKVMSLGVAADSIIYAHPTKSISYLKYAAEMSVRLMTFDGDHELYKIHQHYPSAELVLRIRCDDLTAYYSLGAKYGCDPDTEAPRLIELAKSLKLNLVGISFHIGCGCQDPSTFAKAIQIARNLFDFAEQIGFRFNLLDIGGGFPGDKNSDIKKFATIINASLDLHFPSSVVKIIAEPGQYFVSSAYTLACQVHSKRKIFEDGKVKKIMYFINDGVFGSFRAQLHVYMDLNPITLKSPNEQLFDSSIWGPTCDSGDLVCKTVQLPQLEIDDFIIFEDMGAYTIAIASQFNGFPEPKVEYFIEREDLKEINANEFGIRDFR